MGSAAEPTAGSERWIFWTAAGLVVVLDLITKIIAEATLLRTPGIAVLGDWFQLRLVYNQGAAFGLHLVASLAMSPGAFAQGSKVVGVLLASVAIGAVGLWATLYRGSRDALGVTHLKG